MDTSKQQCAGEFVQATAGGTIAKATLISLIDACKLDPWPNHTRITSSTAGMDIAIAMTTARKPSDVRATLRIGRSTLQVSRTGFVVAEPAAKW